MTLNPGDLQSIQILQAYHRNQQRIPLLDPNFPKQNEFVLDKSRLKAAFCTRRAAKSYSGGIWLVDGALEVPRVNCLYLAPTQGTARAIMWKDVFKDMDERKHLNADFNETRLEMTTQNGSMIYLGGADCDEKEMNKLLGRKYYRILIDEAQSWSIEMRRLIYGILKPATADFRGSIAVVGTAGDITQGLFYDITNGIEPGWSVHTWSAHDNPYVAKQWQEELDDIAANRPLFKETPLYKQWYLNQWVVDSDKLCYKFDEKKNLFTELPPLTPEGWTYVLGIDLGWEDDTAFVLSAFHANDPHMYVVDSFNKKFMTLPMVEQKILEYMGGKTPPARIIIDGAAKQSIETMRVRTQIPFEFADKQGKETFIELLNSDLIQAKIRINVRLTNLIDEMMALVWQTDGDKIRIPKKENANLPNHLCDALLYNWRMCFHYHSEPVSKVIPIGSNEWYKKQAEDIWERERDRIMKAEGQDQGSWPENGGWSESNSW